MNFIFSGYLLIIDKENELYLLKLFRSFQNKVHFWKSVLYGSIPVFTRVTTIWE